ncbi:hypothetical protein Golomagni_07652, partial [Golovinomyces magnicellulatus]
MPHEPQHSVSQLLTLIITTSPSPSAPSTALPSSVLQSFRTHCRSLLDCRTIVVFDTYERVAPTSRLKKGCITEEDVEKYTKYKENCKELFLQEYGQDVLEAKFIRQTGEAEYGSPNSTPPVPFTITSTENGQLSFVEVQDRRLGFGLAVRTALRVTETPYVWVHQHDWALIQDIPISSLLSVMQDPYSGLETPIKYVCLPSGRRISYATSDQVMPFPELRKLARLLTNTYTSRTNSSASIPLTPMFFWHDKPHIASTNHYLQRVFPS